MPEGFRVSFSGGYRLFSALLLRRQELTHGSGASQVAVFKRGLAGARAPTPPYSLPIPAPQRHRSPARTRR